MFLLFGGGYDLVERISVDQRKHNRVLKETLKTLFRPKRQQTGDHPITDPHHGTRPQKSPGYFQRFFGRKLLLILTLVFLVLSAGDHADLEALGETTGLAACAREIAAFPVQPGCASAHWRVSTLCSDNTFFFFLCCPK